MESSTVRNFIVLVLAVLLFIACEKNSIDDSLGARATESLIEVSTLGQDLISARVSADRQSLEIPFDAKLVTRRAPDKLGEVVCSDPNLPGPNYQEGFGKDRFVGAFTVDLTFCSGPEGIYGGGSGYLEARNGDRLFICIDRGQVILPLPEPHPVYEAYFKDPFEFCGGTGRFEGATGGGMTNSLVDLWNEDHPFPGPIIPNHRTDHEWTGTLILPNASALPYNIR